jgi:hypothetical protein
MLTVVEELAGFETPDPDHERKRYPAKGDDVIVGVSP